MRTVFVSTDAALVSRVKAEVTERTQNARLVDNEGIDDWTVIGSPSQVRDELARYQEKLGMTHLVATRLRIGGMEESTLRASVALLAETVTGL